MKLKDLRMRSGSSTLHSWCRDWRHGECYTLESFIDRKFIYRETSNIYEILIGI